MKKTVLVVDDFKNTRYVIKTMLERSGYNVLEAADGKEGLKYFDGTSIDLVITDYNMPNMDGGELAEEIRKISQYEFIPILVLTTETDEKKKQRAKAANITGWIQKPFKMDRFLAIVKKALK